jgi:hypothetical protein
MDTSSATKHFNPTKDLPFSDNTRLLKEEPDDDACSSDGRVGDGEEVVSEQVAKSTDEFGEGMIECCPTIRFVGD